MGRSASSDARLSAGAGEPRDSATRGARDSQTFNAAWELCPSAVTDRPIQDCSAGGSKRVSGSKRRGSWLSRIATVVMAGLFLMSAAFPAHAAHRRRHRHHSVRLSGPLYHAELLMDADSGNVLYA